MIRRRAELDTTNPPGQITSKDYKPTHGGYSGEVKKTNDCPNCGHAFCQNGKCNKAAKASLIHLIRSVDPLFPAAHYQDGRDLLPSGREKMADGCCHQTFIAGNRCADCSFVDKETRSIGSPPRK